MVKLRADGNTGVVAIWTGDGADYDPFTDPLDHLDRVKFHSALSYPKVIQEWTGTVTFSARTTWDPSIPTPANRWATSENTRVVTHNLFAHGRSGQPWVLGSVKIGAIDVAFTGSVPVQIGVVSASIDGTPSGVSCPWARWVTLGADETNVSLFEYSVIGRWQTNNSNNNASGIYMPQITLPITVWVTDEILTP